MIFVRDAAPMAVLTETPRKELQETCGTLSAVPSRFREVSPRAESRLRGFSSARYSLLQSPSSSRYFASIFRNCAIGATFCGPVVLEISWKLSDVPNLKREIIFIA